MKKILFFILLISFNALYTISIYGQHPGSLDTLFGNNGTVIQLANAVISSGLVQPDNKILVIGGEAPGIYLQRYNRNGTVDTNFGSKGIVITSFEGLSYISATKGIVQKDGKIIITGNANVSTTGNANFILARYMPDGRIDSTFGVNGRVINFDNPERTYDYANAIALQNDGSILVAGTRKVYSGTSENFNEYFVLKHFLADGRLNKSFGGNGVVITQFGYYSSNSTSLICQPDGKIIQGGGTETANLNTQKFALVRFMSDGKIDSSFGINGKVVTDFARFGEYISSLVLQKDGKILVAGCSNMEFSLNWRMAAARYNENGSLDESFGIEGKTDISFTGKLAEARTLSLQNNGKIVLAGRSFEISPTISDFALTQLTFDGVIDSVFGENGRSVNEFGDYDVCFSSGIQQDGKIVLIGSQTSIFPHKILLARYHGDPVATNPLIAQMKSWIQNNVLGWYIQNSNSVGYYGIERSNNGTDFTQVQRISPRQVSMPNASANKEEVYHYALRGAEAGGYYRIKAVMQDGSKVYSDVVAFNTNNKENNVSIAPNPVNNVLTVIGLQQQQKYRLTISGYSGNILMSQIHTGGSSVQWNVGSLRPGNYLLTVQHGEGKKTIGFVKE